MQQQYETLGDLDAVVVAISTDDLSGASYVVERLGLEFPIAYDPEATVVSDYGVYNLLHDRLATASTFLIDKEGNIRWKYVGEHIDDRPSAKQVIEELRALQPG